MKLKVFTLVFDPEKGHFEDRNLVEYLANRPVISVFEHFFICGQVDLPPTHRPASIRPPLWATVDAIQRTYL